MHTLLEQCCGLLVNQGAAFSEHIIRSILSVFKQIQHSSVQLNRMTNNDSDDNTEYYLTD